MCTVEASTKWISLSPCPISDSMTIPTGVDVNNYIIIDHKVSKIHCIYKYNIHGNKWDEIPGSGNYHIQNPWFSTAIDTKTQILYLFGDNYFTQINTNSNHISNIAIKTASSLGNDIVHKYQGFIINNSVFVLSSVDAYDNRGILKWNAETNTLTKFSDMYYKTRITNFGIISNNKNNCLLFGGYDWDNLVYVDYILEFNIQTK
eukprot:374865_1